MFGSHHGVIAQMLLDQVALVDQRITAMEDQAIAALAQVEESCGVDATGETGPGCGTGPDSQVLAAPHRLAEIPGISLMLAIVEIGLNMAAFPPPTLSPGRGCAGPPVSPEPGTARASRRKTTATRAAAGQAAIGGAGTATGVGLLELRCPGLGAGGAHQVLVRVDGHGPAIFGGGALLAQRAAGAGRAEGHRPSLAHPPGDGGKPLRCDMSTIRGEPTRLGIRRKPPPRPRRPLTRALSVCSSV